LPSAAGSFNGLRAGISAAKGLAFSLNLPLVGISTLEAEAFIFAFSGLPLCPVHDAGRESSPPALPLFERMAAPERGAPHLR
jgi:hypothetical protein